ncbi:MAG: hypothetical protein ACREQM_03890 [Candidatus Dormibacteraceae bacterium]
MFLSASASLPTINSGDVEVVLLVLAAIVFILIRLMQRHRVSAKAMLAPIVILGFFGITNLHATRNVVAVGLLIVGLIIEILIGLWLGKTYTMWREPGDAGAWSQGTRWTLIAWAVAFAFRIVIGIIEHVINGGVGDTSEVLLSLAATFLGQNVVVALRAGIAEEWMAKSRSDPPTDADRL